MSQPNQTGSEVVLILSPEKLNAWKSNSEVFEDSATSPARQVRSLIMNPTLLVTANDGIGGGWIKSFANVERLELWDFFRLVDPIPTASFAPFHALPSVKSLSLTLTTAPSLEAVNLIRSLPLLEDLGINALNTEIDAIDGDIPQPLEPPRLTGTLHLHSGMKRVENILSHVPVPDGLRFRKIILDADSLEEEEELEYAPDLVERCSNTLEYIQIRRFKLGELFPHGGSMFDVNICPL